MRRVLFGLMLVLILGVVMMLALSNGASAGSPDECPPSSVTAKKTVPSCDCPQTASQIAKRGDMCPGEPADSDGDGVPDFLDICEGGDDNVDTDSDGTPDFCDECPDDSDNDADGDGVCGDVDICPGGDDNVDTDNDGTPDFCDDCPNDPDNDADGDGVCGNEDICPGGDDNADADGDGIPDECDLDPVGGLLDHFKCYKATGEGFEPFQVVLADQFDPEGRLERVLTPMSVCNPVAKIPLEVNATNGAFNEIGEPSEVRWDFAHLTCYQIRDERFEMQMLDNRTDLESNTIDRRPLFDVQVIRPFQARHVLVNNQFGEQELTPRRAKSLCVPSVKFEGADPPQVPDPETVLDHFKCYDLKPEESKSLVVNLADQFHEGGQVAAVLKPVSICNPALKSFPGEGSGSFPEDLVHEIAHLTCYEIRDLRRVPDANGRKVKQPRFTPRVVNILNQFALAPEQLQVKRPETICLPSAKEELRNGMTQIDPP